MPWLGLALAGGAVQDVQRGFQADAGWGLGICEELNERVQRGFGVLVAVGAVMVGGVFFGVLEGEGKLRVRSLPLMDGGAVQVELRGDGGHAQAAGEQGDDLTLCRCQRGGHGGFLPASAWHGRQWYLAGFCRKSLIWLCRFIFSSCDRVRPAAPGESYTGFQENRRAMSSRTVHSPSSETLALSSSDPEAPLRKRWTRTECAVVESLGLWQGERWELVEGDLLHRMGRNRPHVNAVWRMIRWLADCFGEEYVQSKAPIDVAVGDNQTSEPEPEVAVLTQPLLSFTKSNPGPGDLGLVVEVADSTLVFDLAIKAALYARALIQEYWVLDIPGRRLVVHREPVAVDQGRYQSVTAYAEHEGVSPLALGEGTRTFRAADALLGLRAE